MKTNYETLVDVCVKAEVAGTPRHELVLNIGPTPAVLLSLGFQQRSMVIKAKTVGKIFFDHGIVQALIERIPALLDGPQCIYRSATRADSVVVLTYEMKGTAPIMLAVARDAQIGRGPLVHEVSSMYGKEGPDPRRKWQAQGLLLWQA